MFILSPATYLHLIQLLQIVLTDHRSQFPHFGSIDKLFMANIDTHPDFDFVFRHAPRYDDGERATHFSTYLSDPTANIFALPVASATSKGNPPSGHPLVEHHMLPCKDAVIDLPKMSIIYLRGERFGHGVMPGAEEWGDPADAWVPYYVENWWKEILGGYREAGKVTYQAIIVCAADGRGIAVGHEELAAYSYGVAPPKDGLPSWVVVHVHSL